MAFTGFYLQHQATVRGKGVYRRYAAKSGVGGIYSSSLDHVA